MTLTKLTAYAGHIQSRELLKRHFLSLFKTIKCWRFTGLWELLLWNACFIKRAEPDGSEQKKMTVLKGNNRSQGKLYLTGHHNGYSHDLGCRGDADQAQLVVANT